MNPEHITSTKLALLRPDNSGQPRTPLYHQIFLILRQQILDGVYCVGERLPTEQEIIQRYGVSRITARRALDELAAAGFVERIRAKGTIVRYRSPAQPILSSVEGLLENLLAMGLETSVQVCEFGYVNASQEVSEALECPVGARVQRAVRVRSLEGVPFSHLTTYVPEAIGSRFDEDDLARTPLLVLMEREGIAVESANQTISATLADAPEANRLAVDVGSALLRISRVVRQANGRPVEYITGLYRPDRYQYRMVLGRVHGTDRNTWTQRDEYHRRP